MTEERVESIEDQPEALAGERETTFQMAPDQSYVAVWTNDQKVVRKLTKAGVKPYTVGRAQSDVPVAGRIVSWWYRVPAEQFLWRVRTSAEIAKSRERGISSARKGNGFQRKDGSRPAFSG